MTISKRRAIPKHMQLLLSSLFLFVGSLLLAACAQPLPQPGQQQTAPQPGAAGVQPAQQVGPAPASHTPAPETKPNTSKAKYYTGVGVVTKLTSGSIELKHDKIVGLMEAMIMEWNVSDKDMLRGLKLGDSVTFVVEDNAGAEQITSVKKR